MQIVVFILIALAIVFAGHSLLYFSWAKFLNINDPRILRMLAVTLGVLSISFIIASLLIHWFDNWFTGLLYILASVWLGLLLYLFLSTILGWIIFLLLRITGIPLSMKIVAGALGALVLIYSTYGIVNAQYPRLNRIEVSIKNLPSAWRGRTAVQISDLHLGAIRGRGFFQRVVNKINDVHPDIVFVTGDLFDGAGDDLKEVSAPLKDIKAPLGIYFITGNHETYLGIDKSLDALQGTGVTILRDQLVEIDSLQILGIDYPHGEGRKDYAAILQKLDRSKANIVLFHSPVHIPLFKQYGVNLQLAGHTHKGQLWPLNYITNKVYGGYDCGLHVEGDYTLYASVGTGTWGPPMRTGNRPEITVITLK
jgi:predicted MPP superfamily phosphohydrolase